VLRNKKLLPRTYKYETGIDHIIEYKDGHIIECHAVQFGRWCGKFHRPQLAFSSSKA
jgi:hypothetical protein